MPSRPFPQRGPPTTHRTSPEPPVAVSPYDRNHLSHALAPPLATATAAFSLLSIFILCFRKILRKRTVPTDSKPPHRFSYSEIRSATKSFSPSLQIGQGGFGAVYRGVLPDEKLIAVKVMDSGSLQGEREFQNELFFASKLESSRVVTALGYSSDKKHDAVLLIYMLMVNGNLQDALIHRKCLELMEWKQRFKIIVDVAQGIEYLHSLNPPVVHGDLKLSNVLLDYDFSAKIADFGLAWLMLENQSDKNQDDDNKGYESDEPKKSYCRVLNMNRAEVDTNSESGVEDYSSVMDSECVTVLPDESGFLVDRSPEMPIDIPNVSPDIVTRSAPLEPDLNSPSSAHAKEMVQGGGNRRGERRSVVKDYVMEWIRKEAKKGGPRRDCAGLSPSGSLAVKKVKKRRSRKALDWWLFLEDDRSKERKLFKEKRRRQRPREWWKEEYCTELEKKKRQKEKKKKKDLSIYSDHDGGEKWWWSEDNLYSSNSRKKKRRNLDRFSGELCRDQYSNSFNSEVSRSGGVSSTPSMRGTVCYTAPEYNGSVLSEKSDVYSFGVVLLVIVSGRRPLEIVNSPMPEFHRANLIHWARHLARIGGLLDLVDPLVQGLDTEQAALCITLALICLHKSPSRRPSMAEIVKVLTGELPPPSLPRELSPSYPMRSPFKSGLPRRTESRHSRVEPVGNVPCQ